MSNPLSTLVTDELLTPEVLFAQPGLRPAPPSQFKFSPDGRYVTYLQGTQGAPTTLDLWRFDRVKNEHKRLVLAADLNAVADEALPNSAMLSVPSASVNVNLLLVSRTTNVSATRIPWQSTPTDRLT